MRHSWMQHPLTGGSACRKCDTFYRRCKLPQLGREWSIDGGQIWTHEAKRTPVPKCDSRPEACGGDTMMATFFVPGIPAPGGSKKAFVVNGRAVIVDDAKRNKDWRASVALAASEHFSLPLLGAIAWSLTFVMPRPKSHYRSGARAGELKPNAPSLHTVKPDVLKLCRSTEDALKGIAWADDCQVADQGSSKRYGERPGCFIAIREAPSVKLTMEELASSNIVERIIKTGGTHGAAEGVVTEYRQSDRE